MKKLFAATAALMGMGGAPDILGLGNDAANYIPRPAPSLPPKTPLTKAQKKVRKRNKLARVARKITRQHAK